MVVGSLRLAWFPAFAVVCLMALAGCPPTEVGPGIVTCSDAEPCADGSDCVDGRCATSCLVDACTDGFCNEATGRCVECLTGTDCGPGQICDTTTNVCTIALAGCRRDADCGRGFCDTSNGSCVDCRSDDDCGAAQGCDLVTRSCVAQVGCDADNDCTAPTPVCHLARAACVQCVDDIDCGDGVCDAVTSTCLAGCTDGDETEPNEGATAASIASGAEHSGRICAGDVDEFVFTAEGSITASIVVDGGSLVLTLLNSAGTTLATSAANIGLGNLAAGTYRLRVAGGAGVEADYLLRMTVTPPASCEELDVEPNDTVSTALSLPSNGTVRSGSICGSAFDLWSFPVAAGDDVAVTLIAGSGDGALVVTLENTAGSVLGTGSPTQVARAQAAAAGTMVVRVAANADVTYSLRATTRAAPPVCAQTDAEPNDTAAQATPLVPGTANNGQICAGDVDFYRFNANALDDLAVTITGTGVRVRILDAADAIVVQGTASFTRADLAAGSYKLEVTGITPGTEASYGVTVTLTPEPAADPCQEGGLEPDSLQNPRTIAVDGTTVGGRICARDLDFFRFTLTETRIVSISLRFTHVPVTGDLDLRLRNSGGTVLASALGVGNEELITQTLAAGTYTAEVFGFQDSANPYTIAVTAASASCTDDAFEPNDSAARAPPISARAISGVRCPGNDDFYLLRLETGDALDARLTGTNLTMSLVSTTGSLVQSDAADGVNRRLQVSGLPAGRYVVRITGSGLGSANYTLTPTIVPSPTRCIDDGAESNNTTLAPFVVDAAFFADGSYDLSGLTMCANDDVFAIDVPANRTVRFDLAHDTARDLDIEVLEQRGASGLSRSLARGFAFGGTLDEVSGTTTTAVRLFVRVSGFGVPSAGVPYSLGLELTTPTGSCIDDRYDSWTGTGFGKTMSYNNDARSDVSFDDAFETSPTPLSPPETLPSLQICAGNVDVYSLALTAGQRFNVEVTYVHAVAQDIDLRVFAPDDTNTPADSDTQVDLLPCSTCRGVTGRETLSFTATKSGTHFIEVFEFQNDGSNSYQLSVTLN